MAEDDLPASESEAVTGGVGGLGQAGHGTDNVKPQMQDGQGQAPAPQSGNDGNKPSESSTPLPLQGLTKETAAAAGVLPSNVINNQPTGSQSTSPATTGSAVAVTPYGRIDQTRERIAYILLGVLGSVILIEVIASAVLGQDCWTNKGACDIANKSLGMITGTMSSIFTAMIGLVGSVVGFYFGSQKSGQ